METSERIPKNELTVGFPSCSDGTESACNAGDLSLIPGLGRSPGEGNGYPLQCSSLENSMDRRAWQATVQKKKKLDTTEQTSLQWLLLGFKNEMQEELRWRRNRTGRPLSPVQIHQKNIWTLSKLHKEWNAEKGSSFPVLHVAIHFFFSLEHIQFLELGKMLNFNITLKVVINSSGSWFNSVARIHMLWR